MCFAYSGSSPLTVGIELTATSRRTWWLVCETVQNVFFLSAWCFHFFRFVFLFCFIIWYVGPLVLYLWGPPLIQTHLRFLVPTEQIPKVKLWSVVRTMHIECVCILYIYIHMFCPMKWDALISTQRPCCTSGIPFRQLSFGRCLGFEWRNPHGS